MTTRVIELWRSDDYRRKREHALRQRFYAAKRDDAIKQAKRGNLVPLHDWLSANSIPTEKSVLQAIGEVFADVQNWPKKLRKSPQRYTTVVRYALDRIHEYLNQRRRKNPTKKRLPKGSLPKVVDHVIAELIEENDLKFHDDVDAFRVELLEKLRRKPKRHKESTRSSVSR
jgi:hypothetical protein